MGNTCLDVDFHYDLSSAGKHLLEQLLIYSGHFRSDACIDKARAQYDQRHIQKLDHFQRQKKECANFDYPTRVGILWHGPKGVTPSLISDRSVTRKYDKEVTPTTIRASYPDIRSV